MHRAMKGRGGLVRLVRSVARKGVCVLCSLALVAGMAPSLSWAQEADGTHTNASTPVSSEVADVSQEPVDKNPTIEFVFGLPVSPRITEATQTSTGIMLVWEPVYKADGYVVLRREKGADAHAKVDFARCLVANKLVVKKSQLTSKTVKSTGWKRVKTVANACTATWTDTKAAANTVYEYSVFAYKESKDERLINGRLPYIPSYAEDRAISKPSQAVEALRVASPTAVSASKRSKGTTMKVSWKKAKGVAGYQVQYAKNSFFKGRKTVKVAGASKTSVTVRGLAKKYSYYVRVRAYQKVGSKTCYSPWVVCGKTSATKKASMTKLTYKAKVKVTVNKKGKKAEKKTKIVAKVFELRTCAKQKMFEYDTVQGGCTDGKYMYFAMYNRSNNKGRIVKVRIKDMKVVKVSKVLKLYHGNDLTYNKTKKRLVVAYGPGNTQKLAEVNPSTLAITAVIRLEMPLSLAGATASQAKALSEGYSAIAYNAKRNQYAALERGNRNIVILDANYQVVRYVSLTKKNRQCYQGIEVTDDCILLGESFASGAGKSYNIISAYTWDGAFLSTTRLQQAYELENIFFAGNTLYASFYRSYIRVKKVGMRKLKSLYRDNYVYRVKTF